MSNERKLRTFESEVLVTLTDTERHQRGAMLADKLRETSEKRENMKKVQREWSNRIKDAEKEVERIADAVRDGKETRSIMVYEIIVGSMVETRRIDTDEQVSAPRPAAAGEGQEDLPFAKGKASAPGASILDDDGPPSLTFPVDDRRAQADLGDETEDGDILAPDKAAPRAPRKNKTAKLTIVE